jgi:hypothetical protein
MKTLAQYQPDLREASGRYFFPRRSAGALLLSAGLLVSSLAWGLHYPTRKVDEAIAHLATYNELIAKANADTETALQRLDGLLASQPERVQNATRRSIDALRAQLVDGKPVDPQRILADAEKQQAAYDEAQALIAASPFKGLEKRQIPLTPEGRAYLAALDVEAPPRFAYQQLTAGAEMLLKVYRVAARLQSEAETLAHNMDVRINGAAAGPAPAPFVDAAPADDRKSAEKALLDALLGAGQPEGEAEPEPKAERRGLTPLVPLGGAPAAPEPEPKAEPRGLTPLVPLGSGTTAPDPAEAERRREREAGRKRAAEAERERTAARRALEAERDKAAAELAAAERAQAEATRREQEAVAAAEAKKAECTRTLIARAKCAREGYNPVTGEKRK